MPPTYGEIMSVHNSFFARLEARAKEINSLLCVGLDPHPEDLSEQTAEAAADFCLRLIEATSDLAVAFKPNAAFFEAFGANGVAALQAVIEAVPEGPIVLLDAKRGDIASTARAYAQAAFDTHRADAITLNPYLGRDAITPFIEDPSKGAFVLCKTSNAGSADLQDLTVSTENSPREPLYLKLARLAQDWNCANNVGLVIGATHPEVLATVRACTPSLWFLTPGVGAQGGDLSRAVRAGLRSDGLGVLIPVSRGIARASDPRQAAITLRDDINAARALGQQPVSGDPLDALAERLIASRCVRFGEFTLKSGLSSPIYIDLRRLIADPPLLQMVAEAFCTLIRERSLDFSQIAALPYAALPIGTAISLHSGWPMIYPRREVKSYGTRAAVEGLFSKGDRALVVDDLATTGESKFEAFDKLNAVGLTVEDVVVLIDRESGAADALGRAGYRFHAVFTLSQLLERWSTTGAVPPEQIDATRAFLRETTR